MRERHIGVDISVAPGPAPPEPWLAELVTFSRKDTDFVVVGAECERRAAVIAALRSRGYSVRVLVDAWGAERDRPIARSRALLNVHYNENRTVFELVSGSALRILVYLR